MKCWMVFYDEFVQPVWADDEQAAIEAFHARGKFYELYSVNESDVIRNDLWDDRTEADLIPRDWFDLGDGYGFLCAYCDEMIYDIEGDVYWSLAGEPVHGPGQDADCWIDSDWLVVSRPVLEALELHFGQDALLPVAIGDAS